MTTWPDNWRAEAESARANEHAELMRQLDSGEEIDLLSALDLCDRHSRVLPLALLCQAGDLEMTALVTDPTRREIIDPEALTDATKWHDQYGSWGLVVLDGVRLRGVRVRRPDAAQGVALRGHTSGDAVSGIAEISSSAADAAGGVDDLTEVFVGIVQSSMPSAPWTLERYQEALRPAGLTVSDDKLGVGGVAIGIGGKVERAPHATTNRKLRTLIEVTKYGTLRARWLAGAFVSRRALAQTIFEWLDACHPLLSRGHQARTDADLDTFGRNLKAFFASDFVRDAPNPKT